MATRYLFDIFAGMVTGAKVQSPLATEITFTKPSIRKVLILGSGGLSIGINYNHCLYARKIFINYHRPSW